MARPILIPLLLLAACGGGGSSPNTDGPQAIPDFQLPDVNPTSATFNQDVSPRDKLGGVSAWYFGSAT